MKPLLILVSLLGLQPIHAQPALLDTNAPPAAPPLITEPAQQPTPETPAPAKKKPAAKRKLAAGVYPFKGVVTGVDTNGMTFTLKGKDADRTIRIGSQSRYQHGGKPATVSDVHVDDRVTGQLKKNAAGHEVLVSGEFRHPPAAKAEKAAKPAPKDDGNGRSDQK
jgi:hypothetical protein